MAVLLEYYNSIAGASIQSHQFDQLFVSFRPSLTSKNLSVLPMVDQYL